MTSHHPSILTILELSNIDQTRTATQKQSLRPNKAKTFRHTKKIIKTSSTFRREREYLRKKLPTFRKDHYSI